MLALSGFAFAGNGNMLHGFGPVNSSMGGAGAGLWLDDPVGALMFNPALISSSEGHHVSFGTEFFEDDVKIEVDLYNPNRNGLLSGTTHPSNQLGILPTVAYTYNPPNSDWSFGFGLIGIAGFRTDYPEDPSSILFDTPPFGFGRIYTDHRVTKIPLALSYQVTDKLAIGLSLNGYIAELAIAPLPYEVYDAQVGNDNFRYYPQGDGLDSEYAFSFQLGFHYEVNKCWSVGGSITTEQDFGDFGWNSTIANPNDPNFGQHRELGFDLDGPMIATLGVGWNANEKTQVVMDVSWIKYDGVAGFGSPGGIVDRVVQPFGWDDVWAFKIGVQHQVNEKLTLRAGYNYSDVPMPSENVLTATGAPAMFKHHFSVGMGYKITDNLTANMGFYYVPTESLEGPYLDLDNNELGRMKTSNGLKSLQVGLAWQSGCL